MPQEASKEKSHLEEERRATQSTRVNGKKWWNEISCVEGGIAKQKTTRKTNWRLTILLERVTKEK